MDKTERKRLKQQGKELAERNSQELRAELQAKNPWRVGSVQWVARYKELNRLQQEAVVRGGKLYPIPAWAVRGQILSHIYVALDGDAVRYDGSAKQFADRAEFTRITPSELTGLWSIIREIEWDETLIDGFEQLFEENGGRRLIHRLPSSMVNDFAGVTPDQIAALTTKWADREHFRWRREATRRVIEDLMRLARQATETERNLYLWISF